MLCIGKTTSGEREITILSNKITSHPRITTTVFQTFVCKANINKMQRNNLLDTQRDFHVISQESQISSLRNARDGVLTMYQDLKSKKYLEDSPECGDSTNSDDDPSNVRYIEQSQVKIYNDVEQDCVRIRMGSLSNSRCRQLSEIHSSQGESSLKRNTFHFLPLSMSCGKLQRKNKGSPEYSKNLCITCANCNRPIPSSKIEDHSKKCIGSVRSGTKADKYLDYDKSMEVELKHLESDLNQQLNKLMSSPVASQQDDIDGQYIMQLVDIAKDLIYVNNQSEESLKQLIQIRCRLDSIRRGFEGSQKLLLKVEKILIITNAKLKEHQKKKREDFQSLRDSIWSDDKLINRSIKSGSSSKKTLKRNMSGVKIRESIVLNEFLEKEKNNSMLSASKNGQMRHKSDFMMKVSNSQASLANSSHNRKSTRNTMNDVYLNPSTIHVENTKNTSELFCNREENKEDYYRSHKEENRMTFESPQENIQKETPDSLSYVDPPKSTLYPAEQNIFKLNPTNLLLEAMHTPGFGAPIVNPNEGLENSKSEGKVGGRRTQKNGKNTIYRSRRSIHRNIFSPNISRVAPYPIKEESHEQSSEYTTSKASAKQQTRVQRLDFSQRRY
ncbi:unnamed protein product [Moneuplotes crassus]|uniref:Uncharacterized protein n=1 Tax=Euplotes crassus TaxID=5936 RepID=A0AAD2D6C3_EUPCR|nr:unnamed protein product [Moneuplotes crassus]